MEKDLVGYRFHPIGEELINHYLTNKILGNSSLVDNAISEINICSDEPYILPSLSKIKSDDLVWYFFSKREFANSKKTDFKRITPLGFWKPTGKDRNIKDKRGIVIGTKKTLKYYQGRVSNKVKTHWITHEYQITVSPLNQSTYAIYKVMYKAEDSEISYGNHSTEQNQSLVNTPLEVMQPVQEDHGMSLDDFADPMIEQEHLSPSDVLGFNPDTFLSDMDNNNSVQPHIPYDDEYLSRLLSFNDGNFEDAFPNLEVILQSHNNDHKPKKALSGIISDDSDAESMSATSYQETSSPADNVGSCNRYFPSCSSTNSIKDLENHETQFTRRIILSKQKVKKVKSRAIFDAYMRKESSYMVKTEKKSWLITEEAIVKNHKNPTYIYLMNMIIGFILLLNLIGNIIQNIKTSIH